MPHHLSEVFTTGELTCSRSSMRFAGLLSTGADARRLDLDTAGIAASKPSPDVSREAADRLLVYFRH